jgi:3-dehydroquinate dehydratase / shikimate dehydrogenase
MICLVIKGPSFTDAREQISKAIEAADLVELRLDFFDSLDPTELKKLRADFSIPMIFTLRSQSQGGNYSGSEESRLDAIRQLAALKPEYLDLESYVPPAFAKEISLHKEIKLILSYHDFKQTPNNLENLYQEMKMIPADFYKIAVTAHNTTEALKFIYWARESDRKLIAISMGSFGQISRILAPAMHSPFTFATLNDSLNTAPGQLTAKTLADQYHYRSLNPQSAIFGLIGDPVDKSISDQTHNELIAHLGLNAVYVKMQIPPSELPEFFRYAKKLPFSGLSVTMPLKEEILPLLDEIDPKAKAIGAVNTLLFKDGKILGFNTDCIGALNAIEETFKVKGKHIVILGAGGAAKAIAYEAKHRGADVTVLNRDKERALELARQLNCKGGGLEEMPSANYDIIINCTPTMPIDPKYILPSAIAMDIVTRPKETEFLTHAKAKGCRVVYGYQMFVAQAIGQYELWLNGNIDAHQCKKILDAAALRVLDPQ